MKSQILKILQMQEEGKLSKDQAAELLAMLADQTREKDGAPAGGADATGGASSSGADGPQGDGSGGQGAGGQGAGKTCGGGGFSSTSAAAAALHSFVDTAVGVGATVGRAATVWGGELVNMVHRDQGGNSVTLSKVDSPLGDNFTFRGNSINVSTLSHITLNQAELSNNAFNASKVAHLTISRGRLNQCNVSGSSVSHVTIDNPLSVSIVSVGDPAQSGAAQSGPATEPLTAGIRGVTFNATKFVRATLAGNSSLDNCVLQAAAIKDLTLSDNSSLRDSRINDSALTTLRLERATLRTISIERSRLSALTARDITLDRVSFIGMLVTDVTLTGGTWTNTAFRRHPNRENLLQESTFDNCTLNDCEFSGCIFRRTTLRNLKLTGLTVRNIDFTGMTFETEEAFRKTAGV